MNHKRIISLLLAVLLVLNGLCVQVFADEEMATRGYVVNEFIYAVGKNNFTSPKMDATVFHDADKIKEEYLEAIEIALGNGMLKGYEDNTIRPEQNILRVEALVMLSRALTKLEPVKESKAFSDTPQWAMEDLQRLADAGIVLGYGDGTFGANDLISVEQVSLLTKRIEQQYATVRLEDDFYEAVNAKWFRNNKIPEGYISWSVFDQIQQMTDKRIEKIVTSFVANKDSYADGSSERKIADFYTSALDLDHRDKIGVKPLEKYLGLIENATSMNEVVQAMGVIAKETGSFSLLPFSISADLKNTNQNVLYLDECDMGLDGLYFYVDEYQDVSAAYRQYLVKLFALAGNTQRIAENKAKKVFDMQKDLVRYGLSYEQYQNVEVIYNVYSIEELQENLTEVDLKAYFQTVGIENPKSVIVQSENLFNKICGYLNKGKHGLEQMKAYAQAVLLDDSAVYLTTEFRQAVRDMSQAIVKSEGNLTDEKIALNMTCDSLGWLIGKLYVKQYFPESAKQDMERMVHDIIKTYEKRIQKLTWMSEETKNNALKKLETMRIKIGYPDTWPTYMDNLDIKGNDEGGSLIENISAVYANSMKEMIAQLDRPVNHETWGIYPQTINAYYQPTSNEIVFPAGILQAPFYDLNASYEENLGGIGFVIAHEITHAFDTNGAEYDENGNANRWWTEEDYKNYQTLTHDFIDRYGEIQVLPDKYIDGAYTLNENIADMGAMSCILELAKELENPDLDALFRSFAATWAEMSTDGAKDYYLYHDNHAPSKYRTNIVLQSFKEFYDLYEIGIKDGMYAPPAKRIKIW